MRKLLITLIVLAALFVAADRAANAYAEKQAAKQIAANAHLSERPDVQIGGFPFLNQVVGGTYQSIRISTDGLTTHGVTIGAIEARLQGVRLPLRKLITRDVSGVPVRDLHATVHVPYHEVVAATGINGLQLAGGNGRLHIRLPISVPFVGSVTMAGTAKLGVSSGHLALYDVNLSGAGGTVPSSLVAQARSQLQRALPLSNLPLGLRLVGARAGANGLIVTVAAHDTVLHR